MQLKVLLFAAARDAIGDGEVLVEVPDDATAGDVLASLGRLSPEMSALVPYCRLAVDNRYATDETPATGAGEVALIPPVSGG